MPVYGGGMEIIMKTKKIIVSALFIAIATILSLIKLFELPFGGSVTVASMVPIVLIAYIYGTKWGLLSSFVYSIIQLIAGIATGIISKMFLPGDDQMLVWQAVSICILDYILAAFSLGLGGVFKGKFKHASTEIILGAILATFVCWVMHTVSGFIFYGAWAEWFFGDETGLAMISAAKPFCDWVMAHISGRSLALFYSVIYNGAYMLPETIITAVVSPIVYRAVKKAKIF